MKHEKINKLINSLNKLKNYIGMQELYHEEDDIEKNYCFIKSFLEGLKYDMFKKLKTYYYVLSGVNAEYYLVYSNGKKRYVGNWNNFTNKELNTEVLNIFAKDKNTYEIHLNK